jgi:hypothetical protein
MVELPGSLERSTLGDVLGALHRDGVSGALRLEEVGADGSRQHVIYWHEGLIHHIESEATGSSTLPTARSPIERSWLSEPTGPHAGELNDRLAKLEALFGLTRARISFRVMGRKPRSREPLGPKEFLHGRQRLRDADATTPTAPPAVETRRGAALRLLGLSGEPGPDTVRAAFRKLALRWHPDRYPSAGTQTRAALCRRFAELSAAYQELIGDEPVRSAV